MVREESDWVSGISVTGSIRRRRQHERTQQGLIRAKAEGKKLGRPEATSTTAAVQRLKAKDMTQAQAAVELGLGIATIKRHWNKA